VWIQKYPLTWCFASAKVCPVPGSARQPAPDDESSQRALGAPIGENGIRRTRRERARNGARSHTASEHRAAGLPGATGDGAASGHGLPACRRSRVRGNRSSTTRAPQLRTWRPTAAPDRGHGQPGQREGAGRVTGRFAGHGPTRQRGSVRRPDRVGLAFGPSLLGSAPTLATGPRATAAIGPGSGNGGRWETSARSGRKRALPAAPLGARRAMLSGRDGG